MSQPTPGGDKQPSFMSLLLSEMGVRMGLFLLAMILAFVGAAVAKSMAGGDDDVRLLGALGGLVVGGLIYVAVIRKFNARPTHSPRSPSE